MSSTALSIGYIIGASIFTGICESIAIKSRWRTAPNTKMPDLHITQWHGNHPVGVTTTVTPEGMYGLLVLIFGLCGGAIGAFIPQLWAEASPSWWDYAAMGFGFLCIGRVGMLTLISLGLMFRLILLAGLLYAVALAFYSGKITSGELKTDWISKTGKFPGSGMCHQRM